MGARKTAARLAPLAGLLLLAGCMHDPTFEDRTAQGSIDITPSPTTLPARIALDVSPDTDPRLVNRVMEALRADSRVAAVTTRSPGQAGDVDYWVRLEVDRSLHPSIANLVICWPGFLVFAPAWHGLDYRYTVDTHAAVEDATGRHVGDVHYKEGWTVRYTSVGMGVATDLGGWILLPGAPAILAGGVTSLDERNIPILDDYFSACESQVWAARMGSAILRAIDQGPGTRP